MDHNFIPNFYKAYQNDPYINKEITLSYLVSHLTAPLYSDITEMIDNSIAAINAVNYDWFIDADPVPCRGGDEMVSQANSTINIFNALGISNYYFETTEDTVTSHYKPIMSYSSNGVHTTLGPYYFPNCQNFAFSEDYIQTQLHFTYAPGAIFNTAESFNGKTLGTYPVVRTSGHGQLADFTRMGGTVGVGHAYEPTADNVVENSIMFPSYALGYTFIEAAYLGMHNLTGENVVVGDPLTRIAYPCEPLVLSNNTTISSGDYSCDLVVPQGITLTIADSSEVNFIHTAQLKVFGTLNIESAVQMNFNVYAQLVLENSGVIIQVAGTSITFNGHSKCITNNDIEISANIAPVFNNESEFQVNGILDMGLNSSITFNGKSILSIFNEINLSPGTNMNFNGYSQLNLYGKLNSLGEPSNTVTFKFNPNISLYQFFINNGIGLELDNTTIIGGGIIFYLNTDDFADKYLSITNTTFNNNTNKYSLNIQFRNEILQQTPLISNCTFNNSLTTNIYLYKVQEIDIENSSFNLSSSASGIAMVYPLSWTAFALI
jgi:hypothetical protein